ncbi:hypothetical protein [Legionella hackeliae]|uniref:Uncharacterized protein n=1 Tax=Legionella hackeliae TaxID=449 RepID=A0A0A8UTK0_LEGHA|nr:hypothetical protein [Legionella hackeliae]KTD12637.1 hypothetical protein Lhac_1508 [Legionella hackeliae]CEK12053.1 protein of unknown function [Legionella hackeliae]STX48841.1 Uncharacterised protein [Legionella hackeliae]
MNQYTYKGFKVIYQVDSSDAAPNLYKADGYVVRATDNRNSTSPQKFHTEYPTKKGAETEIKKLLEDYIDFEWQEFYEMKNET